MTPAIFTLGLILGCEPTPQEPEIIYDTGPIERALPTAPPQVAKLCINEVMPGNKVVPLEDGSIVDWIELHNPTDERISLERWSVANDVESPNLTTLPPLDLWPHAFLVLQASGQPELGPEHLPFRLDAQGEAFGLFAPDGSALWVTWEAVADNTSLYRNSDCCKANDCWSSGLIGTPGAPNADL